MKTKLFILFFLFLVGMNVSAQSTSADSLLQEIQEKRSMLANWDTISGSVNDKLLAFMRGSPTQISDSLREGAERCLGFIVPKIYHYKRYIQYDKTNKSFRERLELSKKTNDITRIPLLIFIYILIIGSLVYLTWLLYRNPISLVWVAWIIFVGLSVFVSYLLGSLLTIASLIYIFKDGIRESIENFLQKRGKKENKEQD